MQESGLWVHFLHIRFVPSTIHQFSTRTKRGVSGKIEGRRLRLRSYPLRANTPRQHAGHTLAHFNTLNTTRSLKSQKGRLSELISANPALFVRKCKIRIIYPAVGRRPIRAHLSVRCTRSRQTSDRIQGREKNKSMMLIRGPGSKAMRRARAHKREPRLLKSRERKLQRDEKI